ncbi:MAG: phytanoyl-CoA dioxygenase family protein [Acidobacteriota bacterium]|nr:phytanoyl-CoA dioxygenase family protein [Acidobacteriota bacterium]
MKIIRTEIFDERGFDIVDNVFDEQIIDNLTLKLARLKFDETAKQRQSVAFGVRNLLNVAPFVREFADSDAVRKLIEPIAGKEARVVRAIFFDKTPEANWKVPFHQDLTIAVKKQKAAADFSAWTRKANILHVQPPASVLENILTLRAHLDDTDESNGALRVVARSHRFGKLSAAQIEKLKVASEIATCRVGKGGAMLMRPLLLHASSAATNVSHRRVLHFEFSSENLPEGLEWFGS